MKVFGVVKAGEKVVYVGQNPANNQINVRDNLTIFGKLNAGAMVIDNGEASTGKLGVFTGNLIIDGVPFSPNTQLSKTVTVNGGTLTSSDVAVANGGKISVNGGAFINGNLHVNANGRLVITNGGKVTTNNGIVQNGSVFMQDGSWDTGALDVQSSSANANTGRVTLSDSTVTAKGDVSIAKSPDSYGLISVNGSSILSARNLSIGSGTGTLEENGGSKVIAGNGVSVGPNSKIILGNGALLSAQGEVTSAGTITGAGHIVASDVLNDGKFIPTGNFLISGHFENQNQGTLVETIGIDKTIPLLTITKSAFLGGKIEFDLFPGSVTGIAKFNFLKADQLLFLNGKEIPDEVSLCGTDVSNPSLTCDIPYFVSGEWDVERSGHFLVFEASSNIQVPEPSSLALLAVGLAALGCVGFRRREQG